MPDTTPISTSSNVNYAQKYSDIIDERFSQVSLTDAATNDNFDFDGVNKVVVYSVDTAPLNDYDINAKGNRYGSPAELGNSTQELTLSKDKSFTFTIDRRNHDNTMMANKVGAALQREISEVISPYVDKYRLLRLSENAGTVVTQEITSLNAYISFLDASSCLFDKNVPTSGRVAYVTPAFYKNIKLDKNFTKNGDKGLEIAVNGAVGMVDNIAIIVVPTSYFKEPTNYIITHPSAMVAPKKIADYKQHENPQGVNGWLVEGRIYFDAFVLNNKKGAVYVSKRPVYEITFTVKEGTAKLEGATVTANGQASTTDSNGTAVLQLPNGDYTYTVKKDTYTTVTDALIVDGAVQSKAVAMTKKV